MSKKIKKIKKKPKTTLDRMKLGQEKRSESLVARIDNKTSTLLDAIVALDIAPSRSSAAVTLITEAFEKNKEKYLKILESYETLKAAKEKVKSNFYESIKETDKEESENKTDKED
jgi:hypothetical protein